MNGFFLVDSRDGLGCGNTSAIAVRRGTGRDGPEGTEGRNVFAWGGVVLVLEGF